MLQRAAQGAYRRHFELFLRRKRAHDARHPGGQHRLARARRAGHQQMVFPGRRHLQCPLDMILADHLAHVTQSAEGRRVLDRARDRRTVDAKRIRRSASRQLDELAHMTDAGHVHLRHQAGLVLVAVRHDQSPYPPLLGMQHDRQQTMDRQHGAVEVHLPQNDRLLQAVVRNRPRRAQHASRDGEIVRGAPLGHRRGRHVDGDAGVRPFEPARLAGGFDPFPRFAERGIRQADDAEIRQTGRDERLNLDDEALRPIRPTEREPPIAIRTPPVCGAPTPCPHARR